MLCVVLLANSDRTKSCTVTVNFLASQMSCSERNVQRTSKSLAEKGFIEVEAQFIETEGNARTANKYFLHFA